MAWVITTIIGDCATIHTMHDWINDHNGGAFQCASGFAFSIIAGGGTHSTPKYGDGPYTEYELGYPNGYDPDLYRQFEEPAEYPYGIAPYVSAEVIAKIINRQNRNAYHILSKMNRKRRKREQLNRRNHGTPEARVSAYSATAKVLMLSYQQHVSTVHEYHNLYLLRTGIK
jgi:hypothetical protein